jgi:hypothetical protein
MFLIAVSIVTLMGVIFQQDARELSVGENCFHEWPSKYKVSSQYFIKKVRQNFAHPRSSIGRTALLSTRAMNHSIYRAISSRKNEKLLS